jgi:signal transduction histidine kinase
MQEFSAIVERAVKACSGLFKVEAAGPTADAVEVERTLGASGLGPISDKLWLRRLVELLAGVAPHHEKAPHKEGTSETEAKAQLVDHTEMIQDYLEELSWGFNHLVDRNERLKRLHVTSARLGCHERTASVTALPEEFPCHRLTCGSLSLIICGRASEIGFIEIPSEQLPFVVAHYPQSDRPLTLRLQKVDELLVWHIADLPVDWQTEKVLLRRVFAEFVRRASVNLKTGEKLASTEDISVTALRQENQNLLYKLLSRDEIANTSLARDLHDAVIADLMLLKSKLSTERTAEVNQPIFEVLDRVSNQLRDMCGDLAPRFLTDWGLPTVLEGLAERFNKQASAQCKVRACQQLPPIEQAVQLQIYRIAQEVLNNAGKYSGAKIVTLDLTIEKAVLRLSIQDDGKGFDPDEIALKPKKEGGTGLHSLKERLQLIRCFHPAELTIESKPEQGTQVLLEVNLGSA